MTEPGLASATDPIGEPSAAPQTPAQRYATIWMHILADDTSATTAADTARDDTAAEQRRPGTATLLYLGLLWLALTLWVTHSNLTLRTEVGELASAAALSLPSIVTSALLAGAAAGLALSSLLERRRAQPTSVVRRVLTGIGGGAIVGLTTGGLIVGAYGAQSSILILSVTVAAAALVGGAAAALPHAVIGAGLTATFAVLVISTVVGAFQSRLKGLLGADGSAASGFDAAVNLAFITNMVSGFVAAIAAYLYLRRHDPQRRWPWFALAGSVAGLLLLVSYLITVIGGASLFERVRHLSLADSIVLSITDDARLSQALIVLFVGTIIAMVAVGRTIRRPTDESASDE